MQPPRFGSQHGAIHAQRRDSNQRTRNGDRFFIRHRCVGLGVTGLLGMQRARSWGEPNGHALL
jgi:hypothetical protein